MNSTNSIVIVKGKFVTRSFSLVHTQGCCVQLDLLKERTADE